MSNFLDEWRKLWEEEDKKRQMEEQNKKPDDARTKTDYWDNPKYTGNMDWCTRLDYLIIKNAVKEKRTLDLDAIYEDGRLFGYPVSYTEVNGTTLKFIDYTREGGKRYRIGYRFCFDDGTIEFTYKTMKGMESCGGRTTMLFSAIWKKSAYQARQMFEITADSLIDNVNLLK